MAETNRTVHDFVNGEAPDASVWDGLSKGYQDIVGADGDISGIAGTSTTLCAGSYTALANRRFEIDFSADVVGTNAGDLAQVRILIDGSVTLPDLTAYGTVRTDDPVTIGRSWIINLATGLHTIALQLARKDGSGTLTGKASSHFTVKDEGPF